MAPPGVICQEGNHIKKVFERNLPLSMRNPHTKFEENQSKHSRVITWKPFSDGVTSRQGIASFHKEPASVHKNALTNSFQI